jgi:hypothetical protein
MHTATQIHPVLCMRDVAPGSVTDFLARFDLAAERLACDAAIKGSFWGAPEAGIIGTCVYFRPDTPVHSFLHESCHIICMQPALRVQHTGDAGSDDLEESAVCYLQLVIADTLPGVGQDRLMRDMDSWGYSFRLGSTRRWFEEDAEDARAWLQKYKLIDATGRATSNRRICQ